MQDRTDRLASGRFVRNLALSLTGGAILTVIGAASAQAQEAGTESAGSSGTGTGDATAVGNRSGTSTDQSLAPSSGNGSPQVITQTATVPNVGVAVANTGGNIAVGNASENTAEAEQDVTGGDVANSNNGTAANGSDGSAWITTGDATAVGNESETTIEQTALGQVSGLLVVDQDATVSNTGIAISNTGLNAAVGNASENTSLLDQLAANSAGVGGLATNAGAASTSSNGRASVNTGDGNALGNRSSSGLAQTAGGAGDNASGGLVIIGQDAEIANVGIGLANTGGNLAIGNISDNVAFANQAAANVGDVDSPLAIASNTADVSTTSDGDASIDTGDASATGNDANTNLSQASHADPSALGGVVSIQDGTVINAGVGIANSGINAAVGNAAGQLGPPNLAAVGTPGLPQLAINAGLGGGEVDGDTVTASNAATVSAASDGSAEIATGDATAVGNDSDTTFTQSADSTITGSGFVVDPQIGVVLNAGAGIANSGGNIALGNASTNVAAVPIQIGAALALGGAADIEAPVITTSNTADASTASDGSASIHTGDASAVGNESTTDFSQTYEGHLDGAGTLVNLQVGGVANVGLGVANTGLNAAVGNVSTNVGAALQAGAVVAIGQDVEADGPLTIANNAAASAASDGTASVHTGDADATGNASETTFSQDATATISEGSMGVVPNVQIAGVANIGVGVANSGVNAAVGNASGILGPPNIAFIDQLSVVAPIGDDIEVAGPLTVTNTADASTATDGTAKVKTGDATATGNQSATELTQSFNGTVDGMGVVIAPQIAGVANVGIAVANSGVNAAIGNASSSVAAVSGPGPLPQLAVFIPTPGPGTTHDVDGPLTVGNTAAVSNTSDGEACVCTGDATASGNISNTLLSQEMDMTVDSGVSVVPQTAGVLNVGFGLANSGVNLAIGNISQNTAITTQIAALDPAAGPDFDEAQTIVNNGSAGNASNGLGEVGTGNANATGNLSDTTIAQAAVVDGGGAVGTMTSGVVNFGAGIANSGINLGVGNASTNTALNDQTAVGEGAVTNNGDASNDSDGTGQIGDPDCEDKEVTEEPPAKDEEPGGPTLPKTGSEVETQAALALMLLLAGFGATAASRRRQMA